MYTNVDTLLNKGTQLSAFIAHQAPAIKYICISEFAPKNTALSLKEAEVQVEGCDMVLNITDCTKGGY